MGSRIINSIILITILAILNSSAFAAEIYKWEDGNGVHLSDNPYSVPEKYREKVFANTNPQPKNVTPQANVVTPPQYNPIPNQINYAAVYQANLERQKRAAEIQRQQQNRAIAASTRNLNNTLNSLARFMVLWSMLGALVFIGWVLTIVDIVSSEFVTPSNKTVWTLLVIFLPLVGMILYYMFGLSQKSYSIGNNEYQEELLSRLRPRDPKDRDFVI